VRTAHPVNGKDCLHLHRQLAFSPSMHACSFNKHWQVNLLSKFNSLSS